MLSPRIALVSVLSTLCYGQAWNATGTFPVSIDLAQTTKSNTSWTVEIGLSQYNETSPNRVTDHISQRIWTNIPDDPACSGNAQFNAVCGISWLAANSSQAKLFAQMQDDAGDCNTGIPLNCRDDVANTALDYLTKPSSAKSFTFPDICEEMGVYLQKNIPKSCVGDVRNLLASPIGGQLLSDSRNERCQNASTPGKRDSSFSWDPYTLSQNVTFDNDTIHNFEEVYDYWATRVIPFLISSFPVNGSGYLDSSSNMTVDNQLICLRSSNITAGSHKPSEVPDIFDDLENAGGRLDATSTIVLVTIMIILVLIY